MTCSCSCHSEQSLVGGTCPYCTEGCPNDRYPPSASPKPIANPFPWVIEFTSGKDDGKYCVVDQDNVPTEESFLILLTGSTPELEAAFKLGYARGKMHALRDFQGE